MEKILPEMSLFQNRYQLGQNNHKNVQTYQLFILILALFIQNCDAINCPPNCKCFWVLDSLEVDCSRSGLIDCPNLNTMPVERVDLSGNYFVEFPKQLADIESLIYLDLSDNQISHLDADALLGFHTLRTLLLTNNSIETWESINPNEVLKHAPNLKRFSLSGNQLGSFTDGNRKQLLVSESLSQLELERCGITVVGGDMLINGLPNLERLRLSGNDITTLSTLPSASLRALELSNCNLKSVNSYLLQGLPSLETLNLSWNAALQFGSQNILNSDSLTDLDLSYCNLDGLNVSGFPSLAALRLRGNMLRIILGSTFANNTQLEVLDLARNSLRLIDGESFSKLKRLTRLDLSYNEIARLERNVFRSNDVLVILNLSRNVIERFTKLVSNSLREINLSWCEIIAIDGTVFSALSTIQRLDLSNNLIKEFPGGMASQTLQVLNLSNCRLSAIRNSTFRDFPELASLRLNGNRFTNPFSPSYFRSNKFLDEIWLGDNPWICNCHDTTFTAFYEFLTTKPQRLKDKSAVRCASPSHYYGQTWEGACINIWLPNGHTTNAEKVWSTILIGLLVIGSLVFLLTCFQKFIRSRKQHNDQLELQQNQEEMMEIRRLTQRMLDQEGTPNAPSPYETNLPSYEDAILMPKMERPAKSMVDLTASARARRKQLKRARTDSEQDTTDAAGNNELMLDSRQRFRSEEMLSNRDKERTAQIEFVRRTGRIEYSNSGSRRFSIEDSRFPAAHLKSQNLQSAERIGNFQSYENSPYTKRKPKIAEIPPFKRAVLRSDSVEFLTDPEFEANSKPGSPFARRKPRVSASSESHSNHAGRLAPAIEDHFGVTLKSRCSSTDGSEFQLVVEPEVTSIRDDRCCASSSSNSEVDLERGKRKKRKNSSSRRASGSFSAAAAAAAGETSSSDREPIVVVVHQPMQESLFQ